MEKSKYNQWALTLKDAEDRKKFVEYRNEYKENTFTWQCVWLTGAVVSMLAYYLYERSMYRFVILAFEVPIAVVAWLVDCSRCRVSRSTFDVLINVFFIVHSVYLVLVIEILEHHYGEQLYLLAYILRLWEAYAVLVQF